MRRETGSANRSFSWALALLAVQLCFGCSIRGERIAPYWGQALAIDSVYTDSSGDSSIIFASEVDLGLASGVIVYDMEMDGLFDDTVLISGSESGEIEGILHYKNAPLLNAPWVRKAVQLVIPSVGLDTFLYVDAHDPGNTAEEIDMVTRWDSLFTDVGIDTQSQSSDSAHTIE